MGHHPAIPRRMTISGPVYRADRSGACPAGLSLPYATERYSIVTECSRLGTDGADGAPDERRDDDRDYRDHRSGREAHDHEEGPDLAPGRERQDRRPKRKIARCGDVAAKAEAAKVTPGPASQSDGQPEVAKATARKAPAAKAPASVKVAYLLDRQGQFRVHKAGCRDIRKEVGEAGNYEKAEPATYASQEEAIRDLWSD